MPTLRVWDLPTRLFHWALALSVIGLVVTGNVGGSWMNWHFRLGYTVLALLIFRVVWGFVGGHWSRFSTFVRGPGEVLAYLRGKSRSEHHIGHNPLGALSVLALLTMLAVQVGTGLFADDEIALAGPLATLVSSDMAGSITRYHKGLGKLFVILLVVLHLAAIVFYRLFRQKRLVRAMISGDQEVSANAKPSRDSAGTRWLALALFALAAVAVYALVDFGYAAAGY